MNKIFTTVIDNREVNVLIGRSRECSKLLENSDYRDKNYGYVFYLHNNVLNYTHAKVLLTRMIDEKLRKFIRSLYPEYVI